MGSKLRQSEEKFRLALDAAGALVYEVTPDGDIVAHGLERVTGYRADEVPLTLDWWYSIVHPDDLPAHRERVARFGAAGPCNATYRINRSDGTWIWVEGTAQTFKDSSGAVTKRVGALLDVTERMDAMDALRESEQRLRMLHALSGRLLAASVMNDALEDLLDCAISSCAATFGSVQLANSKMQALEIVAQRGFRQPLLDHYRSMRVDKEGSAYAQVLHRGKQVMIEDVQLDPEFEPHRGLAEEAGYRAVISTPMKAHDGNLVGLLSIHFREPHSVSMQDRQLLEIFACHAADLVCRLRFEEALRNAERCKDEFLAMLAHELRSPLAPLTNALELMRRAPDNADLIERARNIMDRQVRQLARLVDDLLDASRIASQKLDLRVEMLDLVSVANRAAEVCHPLIERRSQTLSIELPDEPVHLRADPVRLTQVFCNLITNASKYTPEGGRIRLLAGRDDDDHVTVSICDTGFGIAPELLPRVFDLFMQVDGGSERSGGGLGLGLPLVKRLVEMHGGTVTAHSEGIGRGSRFVVRLPLARETNEEKKSHPVAEGLPS